MNLITASDVHFMMMIYDDVPNVRAVDFHEWIVHEMLQNKLRSERYNYLLKLVL